MTDFNISQFKGFVISFIEATGLDGKFDGVKDGIINSDNGELSSLLSNFGKTEEQMGDLLQINTVQSATSSNTDNNDPTGKISATHEFFEASKKYNNMSEEGKDVVRKETMQRAESNFDTMSSSIAQADLKKLTEFDTASFVRKLLELQNDPNATVADVKALYILYVIQNASKRVGELSDLITKYDNAFTEYDKTYKSPFKVEQNGVVNPNCDSITDACMAKITVITSKMQDVELSTKSDLSKLKDYNNEINSLLEELENTIKNKKEETYNQYNTDYADSMYALKENIIQEHPIPLDDSPHDELPDTLALEGMPVRQTFTEVVNNTATGLSSKNADNNDNNKEVYDLSGRKTNGMRKGINIVNGRKVVKK